MLPRIVHEVHTEFESHFRSQLMQPLQAEPELSFGIAESLLVMSPWPVEIFTAVRSPKNNYVGEDLQLNICRKKSVVSNVFVRCVV